MKEPEPNFASHDFVGGLSRRQSGDFTTDRRVLILIAMAVLIGSAGAFAAWILVSLIQLVTNVVWMGRVSTDEVSFANIQPSVWMVAAPILGEL